MQTLENCCTFLHTTTRKSATTFAFPAPKTQSLKNNIALNELNFYRIFAIQTVYDIIIEQCHMLKRAQIGRWSEK